MREGGKKISSPFKGEVGRGMGATPVSIASVSDKRADPIPLKEREAC